jgi:hypothetical protein
MGDLAAATPNCEAFFLADDAFGLPHPLMANTSVGKGNRFVLAKPEREA